MERKKGRESPYFEFTGEEKFFEFTGDENEFEFGFTEGLPDLTGGEVDSSPPVKEVKRLFDASPALKEYTVVFQFSTGNFYDWEGKKINQVEIEARSETEKIILISFISYVTN